MLHNNQRMREEFNENLYEMQKTRNKQDQENRSFYRRPNNTRLKSLIIGIPLNLIESGMRRMQAEYFQETNKSVTVIYQVIIR